MKLLGIADLAKRWNSTRQGVHQKMQRDNDFPKAIAIINDRTLVFSEEAIAEYEKSHRELLEANYKHWYTHVRWTFKD